MLHNFTFNASEEDDPSEFSQIFGKDNKNYWCEQTVKTFKIWQHIYMFWHISQVWQTDRQTDSWKSGTA